MSKKQMSIDEIIEQLRKSIWEKYSWVAGCEKPEFDEIIQVIREVKTIERKMKDVLFQLNTIKAMLNTKLMQTDVIKCRYRISLKQVWNEVRREIGE